MILKVGFFADMHISPTQFKSSIESFRLLMAICEEQKIDILLFAGDFFDIPNVGDKENYVSSIIEQVQNVLATCSYVKHIIMISGQHDRPNSNTPTAASLIIDPRITIIDSPTVATLSDLCGIGSNIVLMAIPWIFPNEVPIPHSVSAPEKSDFFNSYVGNVLSTCERKRSDIKNSGLEILLMHCSILGAKLEGLAGYSGTYALRESTIFESCKPDIVALGDFHTRQRIGNLSPNDGYIGAARHLKKSDAGNPTGVRIVTFENDAIVEDKFQEIDGPKQIVVATAEDFMSAINSKYSVIHVSPAIHEKVEQLGIAIPDCVRIVMEAPPVAITEQRISEHISTRSPQDALMTWVKTEPDISEEFANVLLQDLNDSLPTINIPPKTGASLLSVDHIVLDNIAKYKHVDLDLRPIHGTVLIGGDNGAGKTTIAESIIMALFGRSLSYDRKATMMVRPKSSGQAMIRIDVTCSTGRFAIIRTMKVSDDSKRSQELTIYQIEEDDTLKYYKGGPSKTDDANKFITDNIGTYTLFKSIVFSAQGDRSFITQRPAARKETLSEIIGAAFCAPIAKSYKTKIDKLKLKITSTSGKLSGLKSTYTEVTEDIDLLRNQLAETKSALLNEETHKAALMEKGTITATRLKENKKTIIATIAELKDMLSCTNVDLIELSKVTEQIAVAKAEKTNIESMIEEHRCELERLEEEDGRIQAEKETLINAYGKQCAEYDNRKTRLETECNHLKATADNKIKQLEKDLRNVKKQIENKAEAVEEYTRAPEETPMKLPICDTCPALITVKQYVADIKKLEEEVGKIESELVLLQKHNECDELIAELSSLDKPTKPNNYDDIMRLAVSGKQEITSCKNTIREANARISSITNELNRLNLEQMKIRAKQDKLSNITKTKEEIVNELSDAEQALSDIDTQYNKESASFSAELSDVKAKIESMKVIESSLIHKIGMIEGLIKSNIAKAIEIEKLEDELNELSYIDNISRTLFRAFDKNGIPQLIVSQLAEPVMRYTNEILSKMQVQSEISFKTLTENDAGNTVETLEILAWDPELEMYRDISGFSGGESAIYQIAIQLSLARYLNEFHGSDIRVLFSDESIAALRSTNAIKVTDTLALEESNQIWIISHHDNLTLPMGIEVTKNNGISTARVTSL